MILKLFSLILSLFMPFISFRMSFMPSEVDREFNVINAGITQNTVCFNGESVAYTLSGDGSFENGKINCGGKFTVSFDSADCYWFNYYGIAYSADEYFKGEIVYGKNDEVVSEEFFLEPSDEGEFFSFIDGFLDKYKANKFYSVSFEPISAENGNIEIKGVSTFNREIPGREVFVDNGSVKIGVDLLWGGALSYFEDLDSSVEAVRVNGEIKVDSNASERYGKRVVNDNVNLINRKDTGRLIQQSYYGTSGLSGDGYIPGEFMGNVWNYNPVQGGNQFNDSSKIVDLKIEDNSLYIKCRPLDWALPKENITPSYMEATYTLEGKNVHAECRFVDFSGYTPYYTSQEIPAFYCVEPLNRFVYYGGNEPWTGGELSVEPDLIFWPDAGYPKFNSTENWSAFIGEFDDSFGLGVYVPEETQFLAGVYGRGNTTEKDPSKADPTSYIAIIKFITFQSFAPFKYDYYLTSGDTAEIRENFSVIR